MTKKACFFVWVRDQGAFRVIEWYQTDIRILRDLGFDVCVAHSPAQIPSDCELYFAWWWNLAVPPLIMARLRRKPLVVVGNIKPVAHSLRGGMERLSTAMVFRYASAVLATSRAEQEMLSPAQQARSQVVYHGIDTGYYTAGGTPRDSQIVMVSHLAYGNVERKCIPQAIEAVALARRSHPEVRLVIVGGGDSLTIERLRNLAARLGAMDHICFAGRVSREHKRELYRQSLLYLQPTLHEGFGVAIAEAMSCELPVVTSAAGAVPELVADTALFADGTRPDEIASQIAVLLEHPELRQRLGRLGRQRIVTHFAYEKRKAEIARVLRHCGVDLAGAQVPACLPAAQVSALSQRSANIRCSQQTPSLTRLPER